MKRAGIFIVALVMVAGCGSSGETAAKPKEDGIVGAWMDEGETASPNRVFFYADGTANIEGKVAKWKKSGDRYHAELTFQGQVIPLDIEDTPHGIAMTWPGGRVERLVSAPKRTGEDAKGEARDSPLASP
ncbi:hypothetical protein EON79_10415 [bacterium]|nr:MAG: hypothetical protein EON79_10415 [bacterium]